MDALSSAFPRGLHRQMKKLWWHHLGFFQGIINHETRKRLLTLIKGLYVGCSSSSDSKRFYIGRWRKYECYHLIFFQCIIDHDRYLKQKRKASSGYISFIHHRSGIGRSFVYDLLVSAGIIW
jgi:hypothetical protein